MNLTGITEKKEVYLKHFYDSITITQAIDLKEQNTLCDVGTGAGFPGIVLKIIYPHLNITLVDSLQKRIKFLNEVIKKLGLKNIEAIHSRVEDYAKIERDKFDVVTARAVAPINILIEYCIPLIKPQKYFIALKGDISQEMLNLESSAKKINCRLVKKLKFLLPFENSNRSILVISKDTKTSKIYPRNFKDIKKSPL